MVIRGDLEGQIWLFASNGVGLKFSNDINDLAGPEGFF